MTTYYLYVMASRPKGLLYIGITDDLKKRVFDHRNNLIPGFSNEYKVKLLVYFEKFVNYDQACEKERIFKKWKNRDWLVGLVSDKNPKWQDLYEELLVSTI